MLGWSQINKFILIFHVQRGPEPPALASKVIQATRTLTTNIQITFTISTTNFMLVLRLELNCN